MKSTRKPAKKARGKTTKSVAERGTGSMSKILTDNGGLISKRNPISKRK
jgi:hypothetical protein